MIRLWTRVRHPLAREIVVVLAIKVVALTALYLVFFSPAHRPDLTPESMERAILGTLPASEADKPALSTGTRPADHRRNDHHV